MSKRECLKKKKKASFKIAPKKEKKKKNPRYKADQGSKRFIL